MKQIIISADSTCDLGPDLIDIHNIDIIPLHILLDGKDYRDILDINPDMIFNYYNEHKVLPTTAAPNVQEYIDHFSKWDSEKYDIIHFSIGSGLSSSYQNSLLASNELNNVYTIDAKNITSGIGLLILKAVEFENKGFTTKQIYDSILPLVNKVDASFVVDSLLYLQEGGRVSSLAALSSNLLNIKPAIKVFTKLDGKLDVNKKYRGNLKKVVIKYISDILINADEIDNSTAFITHSGVSEEILEIIQDELYNTVNFTNIHVVRAGSTISSHCGENTVGIMFIRK